MNAALRDESERLTRAWQRHDAAMLRDYLVRGVEDPRLNVQSVLTRHFLACAVLGARHQALMDAELRFAVAMNWLLHVAREGLDAEGWTAIGTALAAGADNAEGIAIPPAIRRIHDSLPATIGAVRVPNYLVGATRAHAADPATAFHPSPILDTFMNLWARLLAETPPPSPLVSVLEPACGSANDYRFLAACGLARLLEYTGVDLSEQNVTNARQRFPTTRFGVGNILELVAGDQVFDYAFVHDLFEHLSEEALEVAVAELCRVTRTGLCLGFFQMDEVEEHVIRPVDDYHVNTLSLRRVQDLFRRRGFAGEAIHLGTFLRLRFGVEQTHNPSAYMLVLGRVQASSPLAGR